MSCMSGGSVQVHDSRSMPTLQGYCSRCLCFGAHAVLKSRAPKKRNIYTCTNCQGKTIPCITEGCTALAKCGFVEKKHCSVHLGKLAQFGDNDQEKEEKRKRMAEAAERRQKELEQRGGTKNPQNKIVAAAPAPSREQGRNNPELLDPSRWN